MPRDMCDFQLHAAETPAELVVFDYDDNLVLAHETLGYRLPFRVEAREWMMRNVAIVAPPVTHPGGFQAKFEQNLRDGLRVF